MEESGGESIGEERGFALDGVDAGVRVMLFSSIFVLFSFRRFVLFCF